MKRKVIQIAGSTCLISLPKPWIVKYGIKKGEELDVEENGHNIVIGTDKAVFTSKITLDPKVYGRFHKNFLSGCYHLGFDEVDIIFDHPETADLIQDRIQNCIGFEIVDQRKNFCSIKSISRVSKEEFDQILRKIFLLLLTTGQNCAEIVEKGELNRMKEIITLENTNNKLTDFCRRVLSKQGYKEPQKMPLMLLIISDLERVADQYRDIGRHLHNKKMKVSDATLRLLKESNRFFEQFYTLFYKFDKEKMEAVYAEHARLDKAIGQAMENAVKEERLVLHSMANIVSGVYEMTNNYFEMMLG